MRIIALLFVSALIIGCEKPIREAHAPADHCIPADRA